MNLIFATNNPHKIEEVKAILPETIKVMGLKEAGFFIEIPEPHTTLEKNAAEKAHTVYKLTQTACFSEDTGLEVTALQGAPGVYSARYAGNGSSSEENIKKLLLNLQPYTDRSARFRTVICLIIQEEAYSFEGVCTGKITIQPQGTQGFGYDAVFVPEGGQKTFAEMSLGEKNSFSHRKKAIDKLVTFLSNLNLNKLT